jgi:hypothetical protein
VTMPETGTTNASSRILKRFAAPIAATAASAAASYFAKKAPDFFEKSVLPKLREATSGAGNAVEKLPDRARSAAGSVGTVADDLTERAKAAMPNRSTSTSGDDENHRNGFSMDELDQRRAQRATARERRRKSGRR